MGARRGYVPEDEHNFSPEAIMKMRTASRHMTYLINEGYDIDKASVFVGNHFLLSERQRLAIMRSVAPDGRLKQREKKRIPLAALNGQEVWIDGFNTVITLEVMFSGGILYTCMDETVRDLAMLRGTYRIIDETRQAAALMMAKLNEAGVRAVNIFLDEPVSNSGRLKTLLAETGESFPFSLDIRLLKSVDRALWEKKNVISSDSVILDHCESWINFCAECVRQKGVPVYRVWDEN